MDNSFRFKRFSVKNGSSGLKVGTDAVLLGAYAAIPEPRDGALKILDIGTGTGIIALMLAQRAVEAYADLQENALKITGIDIDSQAEGGENFAASPWAYALEYRNASLAAYMDSDPCAFDLIVSNPPYYDDSLQCPDSRRSAARHTESLSYREVITFANDFLAPGGTLAMVLPKTEETRLCRFASSFGLFPSRILSVRTVERKAPARIVAEFSFVRKKTVKEDLTIMDNGGYTTEYKSLTKDFYLNF